MKTFFVLLLAFAFVMPMPQGMKDDSSEESEESSEEDAQLGQESNAAFVVTSSCVVEALDEEGNLDEEKVNTCGKCFEEAEKLGATVESEEAAKIRAERLAAYAAKKAKKPALIAKTSVLLDCKPWDDETNMDEMLKSIKTIEMDGLLWGASKLVPVGYGINKLQVII